MTASRSAGFKLARCDMSFTIFGQSSCERTDQVAIRVAAQHFKAHKAALAEATAVVLNGAFLRGAHEDL